MSESPTVTPRSAPRPAPGARPKRRSRLALFLLAAFVVVLLAGWSAFWFVARARVNDALTIWLAQEAAQQRHWTCPDRSIGGFPFGFEVQCTDLRFVGVTPAGTITGTVARFAALARIDKPNHVIVEATGPLVADLEGGERLTFNWQTFDANADFAGNRLDRFSVSVAEPSIDIGAGADTVDLLNARSWQSTLSANRERPAENHVYDLAFTLSDARIPLLDGALGNSDPATLVFDGAVTEAAPFTAKEPEVEFERWRTAGGRVEIDTFRFAKGKQRLEASGRISLDDFRRPQGRIEASVAGLDELLAQFGLGGRGNLIASGLALLGGGQQGGNAAPGLTPLPPIVMRDGQILVGPLRIGVLQPLY